MSYGKTCTNKTAWENTEVTQRSQISQIKYLTLLEFLLKETSEVLHVHTAHRSSSGWQTVSKLFEKVYSNVTYFHLIFSSLK